MKIYIAGALFSIAERDFNTKLTEVLRKELPQHQFILPQEYSAGKTDDPDFVEKTFMFCLDSVNECDMILAILEGPDADSGTCIEVGYGYGLGKRIIGVRSDFRSSEDRGLNLMVSNVCETLLVGPFSSFGEMCEAIIGKFK